MKLLFCTCCGDIIAPLRKPRTPRYCVCGAHAVWWEEPRTGQVRVFTVSGLHHNAYILGINNDFLEYDGRHTAASVKAIDEACPESYLFKRTHSPLVRIRPGESNDSAWAERLPRAEDAAHECGTPIVPPRPAFTDAQP